MASREFVTPDPDDFLVAFGVTPEFHVDDDAYYLELPSGSFRLRLSYSVPGRSVRYELSDRGRVLVEVFREGATLLRLGGVDEPAVIVDYETADTTGTLTIGLSPEIAISEEILLA